MKLLDHGFNTKERGLEESVSSPTRCIERFPPAPEEETKESLAIESSDGQIRASSRKADAGYRCPYRRLNHYKRPIYTKEEDMCIKFWGH